jgi:hypothetical protein
MNPISRGDGPEVPAAEVRLRLLAARDGYGHSVSFSSNRVLADEGEAIFSLSHFPKLLYLPCQVSHHPFILGTAGGF